MTATVGTRWLPLSSTDRPRPSSQPVVCAAQPRVKGFIPNIKFPESETYSQFANSSRSEIGLVPRQWSTSAPVPRNQQDAQAIELYKTADSKSYVSGWLKNFPPFSSLENAVVRQLASAFRARRVHPGEVLLKDGEAIFELIIIREGRAEVSQQKLGDAGK